MAGIGFATSRGFALWMRMRAIDNAGGGGGG